MLISAIVLAVPLLIGIGILVGLKINQPTPELQTEPIVSQTLSSSDDNERFSIGERTVFPETNYSRDILSCNQKFQKQSYGEAANCFQELVKANRNEPEPLIYYNNSLARERDNPLRIVVVVPVDRNRNRAQEILRGVAQAQNEYNQNNYLLPNTRLLEIMIANDSNDDQISPKVAQEIVERTDILGVIGHNDSSSSKAALKVYEAKGLAMVASTSTSTELKGEVFFRTTINNSVLSKKAR
ncbi:MAG: hypothetical protein F6K24_46160 [Okeania sp. SIO2D1]|nr:hypothetical protein [Okeania sp. SIO2D1]